MFWANNPFPARGIRYREIIFRDGIKMEDKNSMELINRAWARVSAVDEDPAPHPHHAAAESCSPTPDAEVLREFIKDELCDAAYYDILACRTSFQKARNIFRCAAADERSHAKKLQAEYFILTCDTCAPPRPALCVPATLCALRDRYQSEKKGAQEYMAAAAETSNAALADLYACFAQDEARHSEEMKALILCMLR